MCENFYEKHRTQLLKQGLYLEKREVTLKESVSHEFDTDPLGIRQGAGGGEVEMKQKQVYVRLLW